MNCQNLVNLFLFLYFFSMTQMVGAQDRNPHRSFYLGFTYQPYDWSDVAFENTYEFIDKNSDIIFHYLDDGIPWGEAFSDSDYHPDVESQLAKRLANKRKNQKVAIGVNFLAKDRRTLAPYWGETDGLPRPGKWADKDIDDPDVITAYTSFCRKLIKEFKPDFFIYGMEVDSVELDIGSTEFRKLEGTISRVHKNLRKDFRQLPLILTFVLAPKKDMRKRVKMIQRLLPYTDVYAVSIYPYLYDGIAGDSKKIPPEFFSRVQNYIGKKPFGVAETGFNAKTWKILSRLIWIPGNEKSQAGYVDFLLSESNKLNAVFVNWWVPRDLDALWRVMEKAGGDPLMSQWNSNGLSDAQGNARKGLGIWRDWLSKPLKTGLIKPIEDNGL